MVDPTVTATKHVTFAPYLEIWGKDATGGDVAIAFTHNLAKLETFFVHSYLRLELDLRWLAKVGVTSVAGLNARNGYITTADDHVVHVTNLNMPISVINSLNDLGSVTADVTAQAVASVDAAVAGLVAAGYRGEITREMREGVPPPRNLSVPRVDGKVLLVHGFCADKNPFEIQASDWTDAVFYDGTKEGHAKSRSHQQFAEDLLGFIEKQNLGVFSAVGQSQGGLVILHILNYYHTGLDEITSGRKIQSVASPYLGNTALTNLGDLASIVYPECAPPSDLGRPGSLAWLSGISQDNIENTHVYRSKYAPGGLFGNGWCEAIMNTVLENPNDGIVEVVYSTPESGGTVFDVTEGWCHKEDMKWPPSFWDTDRNKVMSAAAGRS